jgi:hypothetical protein
MPDYWEACQLKHDDYLLCIAILEALIDVWFKASQPPSEQTGSQTPLQKIHLNIKGEAQ